MKEVKRRSLGTVAALLLTTTMLVVPVLRAQSRTTRQPLNQVNPSYVITTKEALEWHALKAKGGPALSGNPSWKNFMEFVEKKLKDYGVVDITRNAFTYDRWHTSEWPDDSKWSLTSNGKKIKAASYGAYSGSTPEEGLTAELVYYDAVNPPKDIAGKIVVWQPRFTREMQQNIYGNDYEYPGVEDSWPASGKPIPQGLDTKVAGSIIWSQLPQVGAFIRTLVQGKAAGAVFVFDANYGLMAGMYTFGCPQLYNVPSLYLDREAGKQVIADAKQGAKATIRLQAEITPTETWQLISYLPGKSYGTPQDEIIMYSTHSDGPSISQDDGPFGFLAVAKYFSNILRAERPRTLMFFMDNRHFMPGGERASAAQDWLAKNPNYKDKVVAVIGMEHLGQIEYVEDGDKIKPSGRTDMHNLYVTNNEKMIALAHAAVEDNQLKGAFVRAPARPGKNGRTQGPWYGLGGLANRINKPGFSIMGSMGAYWATSSASQMDRFDGNLFARQVATFAQLTGELMIADMKELQSAPAPARPERPAPGAPGERPLTSSSSLEPAGSVISTAAGSRPTTASPQSAGASQTSPAGTRPATGTAPTAAGGFQQLMKDRLASDFIQDRYYRFKEADGLWMPYSIFVPRNYDKAKKYPLIVMLHGLNITAVQQIRFEGVAELAEKYGYIVVCPTGYSVRSFWGMPNVGRGLLEGEPGFENEKNLKLSVQELAHADTMNVFNMVRKEFNIDENRIFLTGHSMGGAGAYFYAAKHPEIWAAVAPIAGGGIDDRYAPAEKVKNLPFLVMQGEKDLIVRADASRASVAKMKELGIKHTYIEVAGADHEVWIRHNPANVAKIFEFFNGLSKASQQ